MIEEEECPECGADLTTDTDGETGVIWQECVSYDCNYQNAIGQAEKIIR